MIYVYFSLISVVYITLIGDFSQIAFLYLLSLLGIVYFQARETTILHLCFGLFVFKILELCALYVVPTSAASGSDLAYVWLNTNNYLIHIAFDLAVLWFVIYRPPISRIYLRWLKFPRNRQLTDEELTYSIADAWITLIMSLYFIVDIAALVENFIRNMDYLGVNESIAQYFWNLTVVYHLYLPVKNFLNILELIAIWLSLGIGGGGKKINPKDLKTAFKA